MYIYIDTKFSYDNNVYFSIFYEHRQLRHGMRFYVVKLFYVVKWFYVAKWLYVAKWFYVVMWLSGFMWLKVTKSG